MSAHIYRRLWARGPRLSRTMGVVFAFLYGIIALLYPGSFIVAGKTIQPELSRFDCHHEIIYLIYCSFVTVATVGYGDIMPTSAPANAS